MGGGTERKRMFEYKDPVALCSVSLLLESLSQPGRLVPGEPFRTSHGMVQVYRRQGSGLVTMDYSDSLETSGSALSSQKGELRSQTPLAWVATQS